MAGNDQKPRAALNWLKNRRPNVWRDIQSHEHAFSDLDRMSTEELRQFVLEEAKALGIAQNTGGGTKH